MHNFDLEIQKMCSSNSSSPILIEPLNAAIFHQDFNK